MKKQLLFCFCVVIISALSLTNVYANVDSCRPSFIKDGMILYSDYDHWGWGIIEYSPDPGVIIVFEWLALSKPDDCLNFHFNFHFQGKDIASLAIAGITCLGEALSKDIYYSWFKTSDEWISQRGNPDFSHNRFLDETLERFRRFGFIQTMEVKEYFD